MPDFNSNGKILIVNDDVNQLNILRKIIVDSFKHQVFTATNTEDSLKKIYSDNLDVLLLDLGNPLKNNWLRLIRIVKQQRPYLPIIILTNYGEHEYATQAIEAGASDFLTKPVSIARLGLSISNVLRINNLQKTIENLEKKLISDGVYINTKLNYSIPVTAANFSAVDDNGKIKNLRKIEEEAILFALETSGNSMSKAARILGIGRSTLYRKIGELNRNQISRENHTTRPTITTSSALLS